MQKNKIGLKITNLIFLFLTIFFNFIANYLPLNNLSTGDISAFYQNPFAPAGFTFSIWGIIYFLLIIFVFYQIFSANDINQSFSTGPYFITASIANISWLLFWHYQLIPSSMTAILILLFSLMQIFKRIEQKNNYTLSSYLALKLPFSIYTAWVTVASLANFMVLLVYFKNDWPHNFLTIAALTAILIGTSVTIKIVDKYNNKAFSLVIIWAYTGIIAAQINEQSSELIIIITAALSIFIILLKLIMLKWKSSGD